MNNDYLKQLTESLQGGTQRRGRNRQAINSALAAIKPAPAVMPQASAPAAVHTPGDGHDHRGGKGLDPGFNDALSRFIKDSGGRIKLGSGYRSYDEQAKLYDRWLRKVPGQAKAAPPGKSNHNHGLAGDLVYTGDGKAWAHANAAKYGLYFPMSYEPWHIEPLSTRGRKKK